MRVKFSLLSMMILAVLVLSSGVLAQGSAALSTDETAILNNINAARLRENLVHLVPNDDLNAVAELFVDDLSARPLDSLGDVFITRDRRTMDDLLAAAGFEPYGNTYFVDFIPIIVRDFGPSAIIDFWINDFRQAEPQLRTRRNVRAGETLPPIFSPLYREIGIAWEFNQRTQRHYYVIIFVAEPNVLPVVVTERGDVGVIAQTVDQPEVVLFVHDERVNRFGEDDIMGAISQMRVSEQSGELPCNADSPEWQPYDLQVLWTLSAGSGEKTIYVQMCDDAGRSVTSSARVNFVDSSSLPDLMGVVRATQTAAAEATSIAPFLPTVEVILTATAEAQATPTPD